MQQPGVPHLRNWKGDVYFERVPNIWVLVTSVADWSALDFSERMYMIDKALKKGADLALPPLNP